MPPEVLVPILSVATIAIILAIGWAMRRREQERSRQLAALAAERRWAFEPGRDWDLPARFERFELFRRGEARNAINTMTGQLACGAQTLALVAGDYRYTVRSRTHGERNDTTYQVSYVILISPFDAMPALSVRPEGMMDRISQAIGFDDIDFESEEFSRRFCVKGPDKRFAWDVLHPRMMEYLLARPAVAFELAAGQLCLASHGGRWSPLEFRAWLDWTAGFFALWPDHLLRALERRGA